MTWPTQKSPYDATQAKKCSTFLTMEWTYCIVNILWSSHVKLMRVPLPLPVPYTWLKYDNLSLHCCKQLSLLVIVLSSQPSYPGSILHWRCDYEELVVQNLRREPHSSVTVCGFCKLKSCCYVIVIPSDWHCCPNPNCYARFRSKKRLLHASPSRFLPTVSRMHNPSTNRTQLPRIES